MSQQELDNAVQARAAERGAGRLGEGRRRAGAAQPRVDQGASRPIAGVAAIATAQVGDLVSPTTLLTTVSQLDPIKVSVPDQRDRVPALRQARSANSRQSGTCRGRAAARADPRRRLDVYPHPGHFYVTGLDVRHDDRHDQGAGRVPESGEPVSGPGQFAKVRAATGSAHRRARDPAARRERPAGHRARSRSSAPTTR